MQYKSHYSSCRISQYSTCDKQVQSHAAFDPKLNVSDFSMTQIRKWADLVPRYRAIYCYFDHNSTAKPNKNLLCSFYSKLTSTYTTQSVYSKPHWDPLKHIAINTYRNILPGTEKKRGKKKTKREKAKCPQTSSTWKSSVTIYTKYKYSPKIDFLKRESRQPIF